LHDVIIVGIPLIAILAGALFSRNDVKDLKAEMVAGFNKVDERFNKIDDRFNKIEERFNRVDNRFDRVDADLRQFHHITGKLEGRLDTIEKRAS